MGNRSSTSSRPLLGGVEADTVVLGPWRAAGGAGCRIMGMAKDSKGRMIRARKYFTSELETWKSEQGSEGEKCKSEKELFTNSPLDLATRN